MNNTNTTESGTKKVLRSVLDEELKEYKKIMEEDIIPKIVKTAERRRITAAKSSLKHLTTYDFTLST